MLENKDMNYIKGNTVLAPERPERKPVRKEDYEKLRKAKIERSNRLKFKKNLKKRRALKAVAAIFIVGFGLMWNEGKLYSKQQQLTKVNTKINEVSNSNESLRLQLIKLSALQDIKAAADNKLKMVAPTNDKVVYVDFSKNNFTELPSDNKVSESKGIFEKIKSLLF